MSENKAYRKYLATFLTYDDQWTYEKIQKQRLAKFTNE
jgi:hypothetical protein